MKLKKVLMILIALAVVLTMAGVVSATNYNQNNQEGSMKVNYTVQESYTVTIPADVHFASPGLSSTGYVNATSVLIAQGHYLYVNLTAANPGVGTGIYNLMYEESFIPYYINKTAYTRNGETITESGPSPVTNNTEILRVNAGDVYPDTTVSAMGGTASIGNYVTITFKTTDAFIAKATKSGDHIDTLKFTFDVV